MSMNVRTLRRTLWSIATLLLSAAIVVVVVGFGRDGRPLKDPINGNGESGVDRTHSPNSDSVSDETHQATLNSLAGLLDRPLRNPLFDPPPVVQPVLPPAPPPPLRLRLLGTIVEDERSLAIVIPASGQVAMVPVGTILDGAEIKSIGAQDITVIYHGDERVLTIQP